MKLLRDFPGLFYAKIHGNFQKISRTRHSFLYCFNAVKQNVPRAAWVFFPYNANFAPGAIRKFRI
nr:MAG TPA: hypothetical protein [Caudoviricetes sp.]DAS14466.1 MAG TPA: hypothetical protein [Caudoviricetes sp.]